MSSLPIIDAIRSRKRRWRLRWPLTAAHVEAALTAAFFVGGIAAVAAGVAMIYRPAGLIFAGAAAAACAWLYRRAG